VKKPIVPLSTQSPLVSIGVPTYNRATLLRQALEALVRQDYVNLEVIVSDNDSSDETWAVCRDFSEKEKRIRIHKQPMNIGPTANFEFVRHQAIGKYFMWLADDDVPSENYISACVAHLESRAELVLACGKVLYAHPGGETTIEASFSLEHAYPIARMLAYIRHVGYNGMFYGVYRRDAIAGCRLPNILGGDLAWIAEVALRGTAAVEPSATIRRSLGNTSASYERIMEVLGVARWKRRFPRLTLAFGIGSHIALHSDVYRSRYPLRRFLLGPLVAAIIAYRMTLKPLLWRCSAPIRRALNPNKSSVIARASDSRSARR
jgi:glycosyltransferase involved in cell wall biosynthesis